LGTEQRSLKASLQELTKNLPTIIAQVMREVLQQERDRKP